MTRKHLLVETYVTCTSCGHTARASVLYTAEECPRSWRAARTNARDPYLRIDRTVRHETTPVCHECVAHAPPPLDPKEVCAVSQNTTPREIKPSLLDLA